MCGIAGILALGPAANEMERLQAMLEVEKHRGPDDFGVQTLDDGRILFGHRRLSILDLSAAGHQPMCNEDGTIWITYNGEIYNFVELRADLEAKGHRFRSRCDTEVILHAYEEYGTDCLQRLNGMWAFALWDGRQKVLFCARDRLGVKPFYYQVQKENGGFAFASELKALLRFRPESRRLNHNTLAAFLCGNLLDHDAETLCADIFQLEPGHFLLWQQGKLRRERYWDAAAYTIPFDGSLDEAAEKFAALLQDSIRLRFRSDVPVGLCLSGGLDSGSIASIAAAQLQFQAQGFSAVFPQKGFDERLYLDRLTERYRLESHRISPEPAADFLRDLGRITWHLEAPSQNASVLSQNRVMELAHSHVKVLLDGQGGDELLAGYPSYFWNAVTERFREAKASRSLSASIGAASELLALIGRYPAKGMTSFLRRLGVNRAPGKTGFAAELEQLYAQSEAAHLVRRRRTGGLKEVLLLDLTRCTLPLYLHYEDRNSMAFSLEARLPFLDYRLVEFCLGLPSRFMIARGESKVLLRHAMRDLLPPETLARKDKMGFATPTAAWLSQTACREALQILTEDRSQSRGIFELRRIDAALRKVGRFDTQTAEFLWTCLTTELWMRIFLDADGSRPLP